MNKSDLLDFLSQKFAHLPSREVEKLLEKIISVFSESLSSNDRIEIRGFGSFSTKIRKQRIARNPRSGENVSVAEKKLVAFRSSKEMKKTINEI